MKIVVSIVSEAALVAAVIMLFYVLMLTFRSPFRPGWLAAEGWDTFVALMVTSALALTYCLLIMGLLSAGLDIRSALIITTAYFFAVAALFWSLLRMNARLKACSEGRSPFAAVSRGGAGLGQTP